jgi:ribosomal protein S18 acetylase RimI-like enzyme
LEQRLWRDELMAKMEAQHISARDKKEGYWTLYILAIDPRYERKGIARLLVADGLRMADEDDTAVFLTSTMTGKGLYERLGFDTLETMPLGDDEHGSWEEYVHRLERKSSRSRSSQAS